MRSSDVSLDDLKFLVEKEVEKLDKVKVLFECRKLKQYVHFKGTRNYIHVCLALHNLGLPVTIPLVVHVTGKSVGAVSRALHTLGDKNILVLKRYPQQEANCIIWAINARFIKKVM